MVNGQVAPPGNTPAEQSSNDPPKQGADRRSRVSGTAGLSCGSKAAFRVVWHCRAAGPSPGTIMTYGSMIVRTAALS